MKKVLALIHARNKEFYRDRAAMLWTLIFPFIVLAGFAYGYTGKQEPVLRITSVGADSVPALEALPGVKVIVSTDEASALKHLERYETDLVVEAVPPPSAKVIYWVNGDSDKGKLAERLLQDAEARGTNGVRALEARAVTAHKLRYADWLLPGLLGMNIMFGSMFGVGYVIVRYRKNGVLKRLRATPLSAFQFLLAQVISRVLLMVVTSLMVIGGAKLLIGFRPQGSWLDLSLFLAVSAGAMISLGLIVAARVANEEVAEGLLNLMTWPMIFLSGVWFSLEGASRWVILSAKAMPLTHVVSGLRAILLDGVRLADLWPQSAVLILLSLGFIGLGAAVFRWR